MLFPFSITILSILLVVARFCDKLRQIEELSESLKFYDKNMHRQHFQSNSQIIIKISIDSVNMKRQEFVADYYN